MIFTNRRNPSELRGLCRTPILTIAINEGVVTPPSSEVCAGSLNSGSLVISSRNPSELRGLCRSIPQKPAPVNGLRGAKYKPPAPDAPRRQKSSIFLPEIDITC